MSCSSRLLTSSSAAIEAESTKCSRGGKPFSSKPSWMTCVHWASCTVAGVVWDYQRGHRLCTLTLNAVEFLRRLMLHVPPHGFHRRRHFGFLANRVRQAKLAQCRALLGHATPPQVHDEAAHGDAPAVAAQEPGARCPVCQHGRLQLVQTLYRQPAAWDLAVPMPHLDTS